MSFSGNILFLTSTSVVALATPGCDFAHSIWFRTSFIVGATGLLMGLRVSDWRCPDGHGESVPKDE